MAKGSYSLEVMELKEGVRWVVEANELSVLLDCELKVFRIIEVDQIELELVVGFRDILNILEEVGVYGLAEDEVSFVREQVHDGLEARLVSVEYLAELGSFNRCDLLDQCSLSRVPKPNIIVFLSLCLSLR